MKVEILAVGSELLTPYFQDTNSLYLTERLNDLGIEVMFKTIVGDEPEALTGALRGALGRADLLFVMGGLGPTEDDRTRERVADVLGRNLVFDKGILQKIRARFRRRNIPMPAPNIKQAYIIEGAEALENTRGTAPGLWLSAAGKTVVLLPGPPAELKPMFEGSVWPRLSEFRKGDLERRKLKVAGLTESRIESLIWDLYPREPGLTVTTLAYPGQIELHLTAVCRPSQNTGKKKLDLLVRKLRGRLGQNIFSETGEDLEQVIGRLLREHGLTLAVAESCSGGFLSHRITNVPGSSDYFLEGVIVYSNKAKRDLLGVPERTIEMHGAVSAPVARAMATGIRERAQSTYGLSITGIAGPGGGTEQKPVGLVFTALAGERGVRVEKNLFLGTRDQVKFQSSQKSLDMLRRRILNERRRKE
jgi:nicotinamide-nucleotide amidase